MTAGEFDLQRRSLRDLAAELTARAPRDGATAGLWPGLTIYRITEPSEPTWDDITSLSVCIIVQGRKVVETDGLRHVYDQYKYLVVRSNLHFRTQILDASPEEPFLAFVLRIDPALVRKVSADMIGPRVAPGDSRRVVRDTEASAVSELDDELMSSVMRFLRSLSADTDRRVLAPLYLQEMVYRILQRDRYAQLLEIAVAQSTGNPVAAALQYIAANLAEPMTVDTLAEQVNLSPSTFTRRFREVTGRSPYQFVKETRLERARELLLEGNRTVAAVSAAVGYSTTSHFIKEFRERFGATPRNYPGVEGLRRGLGPA